MKDGKTSKRKSRRKCRYYDGKLGCRFMPGVWLQCDGAERCRTYKERPSPQ